MNKRDEVIEAARAMFDATPDPWLTVDLMADFALSREAEIRREIAADLTVIHPPYSHGQDSGINCDICKYIEKLRGKK